MSLCCEADNLQLSRRIDLGEDFLYSLHHRIIEQIFTAACTLYYGQIF